MKKSIALIGILLIIISMSTLTGCGPKVTKLTIPIFWHDEEHLDGEEFDWYAGIVEGMYSYTDGLPGEPFEYKAVTPGTNGTVEFAFVVKEYGNYTVFVFMDTNQNGTYEAAEDYFGNYTYATVGPGDAPDYLELNPYY